MYICGIIDFNSFSINSISFNVGDLLTLACAILTALYMIVCNNLVAKYDYGTVNFIHFIFATLTAFLIWPFSPEKNANFTSIPVIISVVYCGIFASALAFLFLMKAQTKIDATRTAIFCSLEPIFALMFALVIPDLFGNVEVLTTNTILGGTLILFGVIYSSIESKKSSRILKFN